MIKSTLIAILASAAAVLAAPLSTHAEEGTPPMQVTKPLPTKTGHVEVNGVNYYYEVRGKGEPLLVLHGGLFSIGMFAPIMPVLAENREVIAVDLQGHGRSTLGNRPISFIDMADDMAVILKQLGYVKVEALGDSLGGGVALRLAIQHPDAVRRLVLVSTPYAQDGWFAEMLPR